MTSAQIREELYLRLRVDRRCHVFIDRMVDWPLRQEIERIEGDGIVQSPLHDEVFAQSPERSPLLVQLEHRHAEWLDRYIDIALGEAMNPVSSARSVCAFVFSPLAHEALLRQLTRRLRARVMDLGMVYLRYFDPSVMRALSQVLRPAQWAWLLKGINAWCAVDVRGHLEQHRVPAAGTQAPQPVQPDGRKSWSLEEPLTASQWDQLELANIQHRACLAVRRDGVDLSDEHVHAVGRLVLQSVDAGVTAVNDRIAYARYGMSVGAVAFAQLPEVAQAIAFVGRTGTALGDVLEQRFGFEPPG